MITRKYIFQLGDAKGSNFTIKTRAGFTSTKEAGVKSLVENNNLIDGDIRVKGFSPSKKNPIAYNINLLYEEDLYDFDDLMGFLYDGIHKVFAFSIDSDGQYRFYFSYAEADGNGFPDERVLDTEEYGQDYQSINIKLKMLYPFWWDITDYITYKTDKGTAIKRFDDGHYFDDGLLFDDGGDIYEPVSNNKKLKTDLTKCKANIKVSFEDRFILPEQNIIIPKLRIPADSKQFKLDNTIETVYKVFINNSSDAPINFHKINIPQGISNTFADSNIYHNGVQVDYQIMNSGKSTAFIFAKLEIPSGERVELTIKHGNQTPITTRVQPSWYTNSIVNSRSYDLSLADGANVSVLNSVGSAGNLLQGTGLNQAVYRDGEMPYVDFATGTKYYEPAADIEIDNLQELSVFSVVKEKILDPSTIPNLVTWINADNVLTSSGKITQMTDLSGNNNHAVQANDTLRPTLVDNIIDGKPVARFTSGNYFTFVDNGTFPTAVTQIVVFKPDTGPSNNALFTKIVDVFSGQFDSYVRGDNRFEWAYASAPTTDPVSTSNFNILGAYASTTGHGYFLNGTAQGTATGGSFNGANVGNLWLGARVTGNTNFIGDIAEAMLFNRKLTDTEILNIHEYLRYKYNLYSRTDNNLQAVFHAQSAITTPSDSYIILNHKGLSPNQFLYSNLGDFYTIPTSTDPENWLSIGGVIDTNSVGIKAYTNVNLQGTNTAAIGTSLKPDLSISVGARLDLLTENMNGYLAEIVAVNKAVNTDELNEYKEYISVLYGVTTPPVSTITITDEIANAYANKNNAYNKVYILSFDGIDSPIRIINKTNGSDLIIHPKREYTEKIIYNSLQDRFYIGNKEITDITTNYTESPLRFSPNKRVGTKIQPDDLLIQSNKEIEIEILQTFH